MTAPDLDHGWRHADVTALPFPDGTFDLVLCQQGFQFMADRDAAARELRRVLDRPGRLALSTWRAIDSSTWWGLKTNTVPSASLPSTKRNA